MTDAAREMRATRRAQDELLIVVDDEVTMQRVLTACMDLKAALDQDELLPIQCRLTDIRLDSWRARVRSHPSGATE